MLPLSAVRVPSPPLFSAVCSSGQNCCHCQLGLFIHRFLTFSTPNCLRHNDVSAHKNHYKTLGVPRDASTKDIKTAFFELTKKHHPDMNPKDTAKAAEAFQNVTEAYEVLGSDEKRNIYDALTAERPHVPLGTQKIKRNASSHHDLGNTGRHRDWTDLDIDFKDFEHFQRENRKRMSHNWRNTDTSDYFWSYQNSKSYRDPRVLEREALEQRLHAELKERKKREKTPLPTFDQMYRHELRERRRLSRERMKNYTLFLPIAFVVFFLLSRTS